MSMTKAKRLEIFNKYDGYCAYCGQKMVYEAFQVDHLIPQARSWVFHDERYKEKFGAKGKDVNSIENLMPSCRRCNHYKRALSLRRFRQLLKSIQKRLMKIYIFKVAMDYGIVELKPFDGVFYFEKMEGHDEG